jgi:hypothetical protein
VQVEGGRAQGDIQRQEREVRVAVVEPRRSQAAVSLEVRALMKLVSLMRAWDLETAGAMVSARMSEHRAAIALGVSAPVLRQRITRLVARVEGAFPDFRFQRGPEAELRFGYDSGQLESLGGESGNGH